jgi:aryl sulfotransferase
MQRIVGMLVAGSAEPERLFARGGWPDLREGDAAAAAAALEAIPGRRVIKSHIPADGMPLHDAVRYIHVARDGLDACMSYHNHCLAYTAATLALHDANGLADPDIGVAYPRAPEDPRAFFADWLRGGQPGSFDELGFARFQAAWWEERRRPNVLMVHYNDLSTGLAGEVARLAAFLGIAHPPGLMAAIVEAARFESMRRDGAALAPNAPEVWEGGMDRFLHQGRNGRWRGVLEAEDIDAYEALMAPLPAACRRWVASGRLAAGDPRAA